METVTREEEKLQKPQPARPFSVTVLCLFSFVFLGMLTLICLAALYYNSSLREMVLRYMPETRSGRTGVFFYAFGGFVLHALAFSGTLLIWRMRKKGFFLFSIPAAVIAVFLALSSSLSIWVWSVYFILIIAFGSCLRKMH